MTSSELPAAKRKGVLLVNLGSPDSTSTHDVGRYLNEFLMDERVIDYSYLPRFLLVHGLIVPFREKNSAHAYRAIWTPEGSPLIVISRCVRDLVQAQLEVPVGLGMRYGNPSIEAGFRELLGPKGDRLDKIFLIPLYPHYAMSSFETVVVEANRVLKKINPGVSLKVHVPFYQDPDYINAMVESARGHLDSGYDHILFSYHGIPERHVKKTDPTGCHCLQAENCCAVPSVAHATCYRHQVFETTAAFVRRAGIPEGKHSLSFQSRLGRSPWLKPYTDYEIPRLAQQGVKRLLVICPAFVSDCLETLEEIGIRGRDAFLQAGGESCRLIPCMNDHPEWINTLATWCRQNLS